ncbi:dihydroorotase, partial [Rhodococcus koreensis]
MSDSAVTGETVLIKNVLLYGEGEPTDVLLGDGVIAAIGADAGKDATPDAEVIDAAGQI